jgi:hypothetical protein
VKVAWLTVAPVKALALLARDEVQLEPFGVAENRRFHLVDENGRLLNRKIAGGELLQVQPAWDEASDRLALTLPDGSVVESAVALGEPVTTNFYGRPVAGREVVGPWADALSALADRHVRLVRPDDVGTGVDRGTGAAVTLLSRGSLDELAAHAGTDAVDERRFRMLIGVDGARAHEEDEWLGRTVRLGEAIVRPLGNVGRCAVTTQDPDTGVVDLDTLRLLRDYRPNGTEPLPFGVFGEVVEPGRVRVGDLVEPL